MRKFSQARLTVRVLLMLGACGSAVAAASPPGSYLPAFTPSPGQPNVPSPGYPNFWALNASATLQQTGSGYELTIAGSNPNRGYFDLNGAQYAVGSEQVRLTANFSAAGVFQAAGSTIEIDGSLRASSSPTRGSVPPGYSWTAQSSEQLFKASLTDVGVDSRDEALGFSISNFSGWANQSQFTHGGVESLWLYSVVNSESGSNGWTSSHSGPSGWDNFLAEISNHARLKGGTFYGISSITTVPLPLPALLLAAGMGALGLFRRRRALADR